MKRFANLPPTERALPVIADADTGYGNALHVQRTVRLSNEPARR